MANMFAEAFSFLQASQNKEENQHTPAVYLALDDDNSMIVSETQE